jgi:hypothetical protein
MHKLNEAMDDIIKYKDYILHAHIDYPLGEKRFFPKEGDGFDYKPYLCFIPGRIPWTSYRRSNILYGLSYGSKA